MEFAVETVSSTRKKVALKLTVEDVNAAIGKTVAAYRKDLAIPGFRKGKVPAAVVERRFGEEILSRATQDTVNESLRKALEEASLAPLSRMEMDSPASLVKDEAFNCSVQFDVLPAIDFPPYTGLEVEEDAAAASPAEIDEIISNMRESMGDLVDVTEARTAQDGDTVDVDYSGFEPDDTTKPVDDVKGEHFSLVLGKKQALDDFENLVKTAKAGEEKEGIVAFPDDYAHTPLAGKKVLFRIKLNAIQSRILPEVNEDFAKKAGFEDLAKMHSSVEEHILTSKKQASRGAAMQKLLDGLLAQVSFDIPESLLEGRINRVLGDRAMRLQRMGKSLEELGKSNDELREEAKAEALESLRPQVFLMALAEKEKLSVSEREVEIAIYTMAMRAQQDYNQVREAYQRSGLIHELHDRLLADKAMDMIYGKAVVKSAGEAPKAEKSEEKPADAE